MSSQDIFVVFYPSLMQDLLQDSTSPNVVTHQCDGVRQCVPVILYEDHNHGKPLSGVNTIILVGLLKREI